MVKLSLTLLFAIYAQQAMAATPLLPPKEYDHPYKGGIIVTHLNDDNIDEICGKWAVACTYADPSLKDVCYIYMRKILIMPHSGNRVPYNKLFRHERAHCNGWIHD